MQQALLSMVKLAGFLPIAIAAPNMLKILPVSRASARRSIDNLIRHGLIKLEIKNNRKVVRLTEKGEVLVKTFEARDFKFKKPKRWDGKFRLIIFDIREKRKTTRNRLRETLMKIGFIRLQNSVWVFPYDCENLITLLKADFKIGKEVLYIIADKVENDAFLRKQFNLGLKP